MWAGVFAHRWLISLFQLSLTKHLLLEERIHDFVCSLNLPIQYNCLIQMALLISQLALGSIRNSSFCVCCIAGCPFNDELLSRGILAWSPALLAWPWMPRLLWRQSFVVARQIAVVDISSRMAVVAQSTPGLLLRLPILLKSIQSTIGGNALLRFLLRTLILIMLDGSSSTYQWGTR